MSEEIRSPVSVSRSIIPIVTSKLKEYGNNAKKHPKEQIDKIIFSIKEFGFINPIIIDENKEILAGHGRYKAAKKLKMSEVPCIMRLGLTEHKKKAYRLIDNFTQETEFNAEMVITEIESIEGYGIEDLSFKIEELEPTVDHELQSRPVDTEVKAIGHKVAVCPECGCEFKRTKEKR